MYDAASKGWSNTTMSKYGDEMKQSGSMRVKPLVQVNVFKLILQDIVMMKSIFTMLQVQMEYFSRLIWLT